MMRTFARQHRSQDRDSISCVRCSDIVKSGYLHIKRPPSHHSIKIRLKAWQKRYFVLRDESFETAGTTVLEMYDTQTAWMQAEREGLPSSDLVQYTVDLRNVSHVEEYAESKCYPFAFVVTRSGQSPLVMGADSDVEMKEWLVAIKLLSDKMKHILGLNSRGDSLRRPSCPAFLKFSSQLPVSRKRLSSAGLPEAGARPESVASSNSTGSPFPSPRPNSIGLSSSNSSTPLASPSRARLPLAAQQSGDIPFPVKVIATEASIRNGISGNHYALCVVSNEIILRHLGTSNEIMKWPVNLVKKFKSEPIGSGVDHVVLEASKSCGLGEGTYILATMCGAEIVEQVRKASKTMTRKQDNSTRHMELQMSRLKMALSPPVPMSAIDRAPSAPCLNAMDAMPASIQAPARAPVPAQYEAYSKRVVAESHTSSSSTSSQMTSTSSIHTEDVQFCLGAGYLELLQDPIEEPLEEAQEDPLSLTVPNPIDMEDEAAKGQGDELTSDIKLDTPPPIPPRTRQSQTPSNNVE